MAEEASFSPPLFPPAFLGMFVLLVFLAGSAFAAYIGDASMLPRSVQTAPSPPSTVCTQAIYNITVPPFASIPFSSAVSNNPNQTVVTAYFQEYLASSTNFTDTYMTGSASLSGTYQISGTLCIPASQLEHPNEVQLLVHGISFDSIYWDFPYESTTYSYVYAAAAAGYTTFRYDKLGTGQSEYPTDGYRVVQAATDLAILNQISSLLRSGAIGGIAYSKVIVVAHSYGSLVAEALAANYPSAADALVLTGFSAYPNFVPLFIASGMWSIASNIDPSKYTGVPTSYLIPAVSQATQLNFYYFPYFDNNVFNTAWSNVQPITQGVMFTFEYLETPAVSYAGPVFVVTGAQDWDFCGGNCYQENDEGLNLLQQVGPVLFPNADVTTYSPENTGHNINLHYSAPQTFAKILQWIDAEV